jgi:imidazolonepropionase-like amidohydrolase
LRADRIVTGESVYEDGAILIDEGVVESVGSRDDVSADGAVTRSLDGYTLLPGLIDGHVHITGPDPAVGAVEDLFQHSTSEVTIRALENARKTIEAGVTTVRDLGSPNDVAMAVRDAIAAGSFPGPRILTSGQGLTATAGHGDHVPWHVETHLATESGELGSKGLVVDGVDEVRRAVRRQVKLGADLIKVWATDGINDVGGGRTMSFSRRELEAIVDEATRHDLPVAAHAYGTDAIEACVRAGVRSIEHGHFMDEGAIEAMADHDVFLTFTYAAFHRLATADRYDSENPRSALEHQRSMLPLARERGVSFAMGTDAGTVVGNGDNAVELRHLRDAGFEPLEAIRIATVETARMLGLDSVGSLQAGYTADLIGVRGNPLSDVTLLEAPENIDLVLKEGQVVKDTVT